MATLYSIDGMQKEVKPKVEKGFSLEELQSYVEGNIECVELPDGMVLVVNEEGKLKNLPVNRLATQEWEKYFGATDIIVGNALICNPNDFGELT